jgi:hypothetical protein
MFKVTKGADTTKGIKTVIYGVEGIGKTTLAAKFPHPIFIDLEGSTTRFNVERLEKPESWDELKQMIKWLGGQEWETVILDTFDWAESLEVEGMLKEHGWKSITSPGYGDGFKISSERIMSFLRQLESDLIAKGKNVVLVCHSQIRKVDVPEENQSYERYELKLGDKTTSRTSPLVKEWADMILFCNYKIYVETTSGNFGAKKGKVHGGKERTMYANRTAVFDAKNRFGLEDELPMEWDSIKHIFAKKPVCKPAERNPEPDVELKHRAEAEPQKQEPVPIVFPDEVPQFVKDFCEEKIIYPEDVQVMLFNSNIAKVKNYDLARVPVNFWKSFVNDFDNRWAEKVEEAKKENLPF